LRQHSVKPQVTSLPEQFNTKGHTFMAAIWLGGMGAEQFVPRFVVQFAICSRRQLPVAKPPSKSVTIIRPASST
jgi:hypothetical protein